MGAYGSFFMQSVIVDEAVSIGHQPVHSCAESGQKSLGRSGSKTDLTSSFR